MPVLNGTHDFCSSGVSANIFSDLGGTPQNGGVWTGPSVLSGGDLGTFNPAVNVAGTYTYTVTVVGCGSLSADVVVTLENAPDAGTNGSITFCDAGPGADLFLSLTGTPDVGGVWSPIMTSGTGVFDPLTDLAGNYTYTVSGIICPNATATVMVSLETSPDAGANGTHTFCSSDSPADLFLDLTGTPQAGGTWSPVLTSGTGVFDPSIDAAAIYTYTITGTACPNATADVTVTVNTAPDAGIDNNIGICITASATDLFNQLGGTPDVGGTWSPVLTSGTGVFDPALDVAGTYTYTVNGIAPCMDASASITVNITASDDATFVYPDFCAGTGGSPTSAVTPGGTWTFNPNPGDGSLINGLSGAITGEVAGSTYMVEYTTPAGPCQASMILSVNIGTPANAGTNGTHDFCSNDSSSDLFSDLGGSPNTGGTWSPILISGTGVFDPAVDAGGVYTYTITGTNGCANATADVSVTIEAAPDAGSNGSLSICNTGAPVDLFTVLGGIPQAGGTWSPALTSGTGIFDPAIDAAATYTYTVNGVICASAVADVVVTITATDDPTFAFADFCEGSANGPTGIVTPGGTFNFNPATSDGSSIDPSTGIISNAVGGSVYTVEYTTPAGPCQNSSSISVNIGTAPNAGSNGLTTICSDNGSVDLFTILSGVPDAGGAWTPALTSGTGIFDPLVDGAGIYTYTIIGTNGCSNAASTVTVSIDLAPGLANAGTDQSICDTVGVITLNGNTPASGSGTWNLLSGSGTVSNINLPGSTVTGLTGGTTILTWTFSNGSCMPTLDSVIITVNSCNPTIALEIPTGFTPDGDGVNDVWDIPGITQYPNVVVEIFNRWGSSLFSSNGYSTPWDGKYNGKEMPIGSYYFTIDLGDGSEVFKGTVTIVK
jgi:gliding motility-associated-like protein